ncbi:hemerythrin HHE cation-binding protein [Helicobacter sp. MIT 00-7814]|uniref:hemerythrin domain-containing protein n=1 Tax=unclassified Helicobacter TaxID=2593540 RepID=UPI000E1EA979|nr:MULTISPECIES: hemerythrin domain-containing protein [unclassified Helicobacter]RDU56155.1 hemerythrin HHE cation-binding protein [Helicobacter sp. MIT 99-10781]RDU56252.1 hemerythrin HHE cation-binding protein [Helicobacter sp. MIT 00-7814]
MQIKEFMTQDHRECDSHFALVEEALQEGDFKKAQEEFEKFISHTLRHFAQEEELLFVEFSNATGMSGGPVEVMKYEHSQLRGLLEQLKGALVSQNAQEFFGISEGMMILLQQHNMKEEQMLYNMIQMQLGGRNDELVEKLKNF